MKTKQQPAEWVRPTKAERRDWVCNLRSCGRRPVVAVRNATGGARCSYCAKLDGIRLPPVRKAKKRKPAAKVTTWSGWGIRCHFELTSYASEETARAALRLAAPGCKLVAHAPNQVWIRVRLLVGAGCDLVLGRVSCARLGFALVKYKGILV